MREVDGIVKFLRVHAERFRGRRNEYQGKGHDHLEN